MIPGSLLTTVKCPMLPFPLKARWNPGLREGQPLKTISREETEGFIVPVFKGGQDCILSGYLQKVLLSRKQKPRKVPLCSYNRRHILAGAFTWLKGFPYT